MKYGRSLQELAIELDRQAKVKKDYVATAGAMQMTAVNENFDLVIGNTPFQLNENAHRQLGLQLKIPAPYYERMRAENPGLLMANVNGWFQQSPDTRRMVRTLDGTARAILSDRYRRIDNYEVAQTVLPIISEMQGARIESCELTDTRMYIKVVNERIQTEVVPGDIVQAGILISNSEVGMGSVSVKPLIYRLVCTNGMVADVGVESQIVGALEQTAKTHGKLDILVNNAMAYTWGGIEAMSTEDWQANFGTSVDGTFWGTRTALKLMKNGGGSIVNLSSICGTLGTPYMSGYSAAKAAVINFSRAAAAEGAAAGAAKISRSLPVWQAVFAFLATCTKTPADRLSIMTPPKTVHGAKSTVYEWNTPSKRILCYTESIKGEMDPQKRRRRRT